MNYKINDLKPGLIFGIAASVLLNLEKHKSESFQKKKTKEEEYARYDKGRQKADKMHEDLRLAVIDHKITNLKKEPVKLIKIRKNLDVIEKSQNSQKQLLKYLSIQEKLNDDLANSAQRGDLEACRDLIRKGAVVNDVDSAGFLPLHYACSSGNCEVAKLLLEFGSDCSSYLTGCAPIVIAAKNGHPKIIDLLVSFGCSVEDTGAAGTPPLVAACSTNQLDSLQALVNLGANLDATDIEGNTGLHVCAKTEKSAPCIRFLLMSGADTKLFNLQGVTAITVIIMYMLKMVKADVAVALLQVALNCLNVSAMEALGGRSAVNTQDDTVPGQLTGEGYEEMPALGVDNSASCILPQDSKIDAIPYNESSIISQEYGQ